MYIYTYINIRSCAAKPWSTLICQSNTIFSQNKFQNRPFTSHTHTFRYQTSCLLSWWFMQPSSVLKKSGAEFIHCTQNLSVSALDNWIWISKKIRWIYNVPRCNMMKSPIFFWTVPWLSHGSPKSLCWRHRADGFLRSPSFHTLARTKRAPPADVRRPVTDNPWSN